jgi:uncharacterized Fe-S cluster protein YjdI
MTKHYTKGGLTMVWQPESCQHSTLCWKGMREVFDPQKSPWVNIEGAEQQHIIDQVKKCPSGALSYVLNEEKSQQA